MIVIKLKVEERDSLGGIDEQVGNQAPSGPGSGNPGLRFPVQSSGSRPWTGGRQAGWLVERGARGSDP